MLVHGAAHEAVEADQAEEFAALVVDADRLHAQPRAGLLFPWHGRGVEDVNAFVGLALIDGGSHAAPRGRVGATVPHASVDRNDRYDRRQRLTPVVPAAGAGAA